jgi:hypothetical protein
MPTVNWPPMRYRYVVLRHLRTADCFLHTYIMLDESNQHPILGDRYES